MTDTILDEKLDDQVVYRELGNYKFHTQSSIVLTVLLGIVWIHFCYNIKLGQILLSFSPTILITAGIYYWNYHRQFTPNVYPEQNWIEAIRIMTIFYQGGIIFIYGIIVYITYYM